MNTERYSEIVSEIEKFIEAKKRKPTIVGGTVEKIDSGNNILTIKLQSIKQSGLSRGSLILIKEDNSSGDNVQGTVRSTYNHVLKLEIKNNPLQFENKKVIIDTNKINVILKRLENIVKKIKEGKLSSDNVRVLDFIIGKDKPQYNKKRINFISTKLNNDQKESISKSIETNDFHLIIGPPGTGKTYVIEELIGQFSQRKQKLLITAWTNLAVDNIVKRLLKKETKKIVRIGPISGINPEIKKYSIFEMMKKHKDWKEIEKQQRIIDDFFKIMPEIKEQINQVQMNINQTKGKVNILKGELNGFLNEKQKYEELFSKMIIDYEHVDISSINKEMVSNEQKSEACLSLSNVILQMDELQAKIPEADYIQKLRKQTKNKRIAIIGKSIASLLSQKRKGELEKIRQEYKNNKGCLERISQFQKKYSNLKMGCEKEFNIIYPNGKGNPDKDALNFEFGIYKILINKYLPSFKKQEGNNTKRRIYEIGQEVYRIYLESLERKIDLLNIKIKNLNTEIYIQINHKEDLYKRYKNTSSSIEFYKNRINKLKKDIISEIINNADLIAATVISSCHNFLDYTNFDVMIMDESSQVASFMSLLPLLKCKKFILVGDNRQLQPIEEEDISKELNLSIFNRFFETYPKNSTLLTMQYRMHKNIAEIVNEIFYEGKLRTSKKVAERVLSLKKSKQQLLNPKITVMFIDTSNVEYYEDEVGSGCSNAKEAKYIAYIVSLFIKKEIEAKTIGVITPYVKQKFLIEEYLKDIKIRDVEVNTVHKFQGREKDIIMMSFARSKKYSFPQYKLKFIENETLVNVAISRAKKKLIIIGNSKTLCKSKLLNKVISKIGKENTIIL